MVEPAKPVRIPLSKTLIFTGKFIEYPIIFEFDLNLPIDQNLEQLSNTLTQRRRQSLGIQVGNMNRVVLSRVRNRENKILQRQNLFRIRRTNQIRPEDELCVSVTPSIDLRYNGAQAQGQTQAMAFAQARQELEQARAQIQAQQEAQTLAQQEHQEMIEDILFEIADLIADVEEELKQSQDDSTESEDKLNAELLKLREFHQNITKAVQKYEDEKGI